MIREFMIPLQNNKKNDYFTVIRVVNTRNSSNKKNTSSRRRHNKPHLHAHGILHGLFYRCHLQVHVTKGRGIWTSINSSKAIVTQHKKREYWSRAINMKIRLTTAIWRSRHHTLNGAPPKASFAG